MVDDERDAPRAPSDRVGPADKVRLMTTGPGKVEDNPKPITTMNSTVTVRTVDGLRVALAGFPSAMPVKVGEGLDIVAATVQELRAIKQMSGHLEILIPYRLRPDSVVLVNPFIPEWEFQSER